MFHGVVPIVYFFVIIILFDLSLGFGCTINRMTPYRTYVCFEKMPRFCGVTYYVNQKLIWSLPNFRSNGLIKLIFKKNLSYIIINILPNFIKIGQELFEIIDNKTHTHTQTDRQTDTQTIMKIIPVQNQRFWDK